MLVARHHIQGLQHVTLSKRHLRNACCVAKMVIL